MLSALYRAKELPDVPGFVQVGVDSEGLLLLHAAPGQEPLDGMEVVKDGLWTWDSLIDTHPEDAVKVLRCLYEKPVVERVEVSKEVRTQGVKEEGGVVALEQVAEFVSRFGVGIAEEIPVDAVIMSDSIPPHMWAGDE